MKMENVTGGKFVHNGVTYTMEEARYNGVKVWPLNYTITYQVVQSSVRLVYSSGTKLLASGQNYVSAYGNVQVFHDSVYHHTNENVQLSIALIQGSVFYLVGQNVYGPYLNDNLTSEYSETIQVYYDTSTYVSAGQVTQEANTRQAITTPEYSERQYGIPQVSTYGYSVSISADKYTSSASACSAKGSTATLGSATLTASGSHTKRTDTDWFRTVTTTYEYTSTRQKTETVPYDSGTETTIEPVTDTITSSMISEAGSSGFSRSGFTVSIASAGTTSLPSGRSRRYTVTAADGETTDYVILYQGKNEIVDTIYGTPERTYGTPETTTAKDQYSVTLYAPNYTTSQTGAPASGGATSLVARGYHMETPTTVTPWTDVSSVTYVWTSDATSPGESVVVDSGSDTTTGTATQVEDTPTVTGGATWLTYTQSTDALVVQSAGTTIVSNGRSATFTASNGSATPATLTIYQLANTRTTSYAYERAIEIQYTGNLPSSASTYSVTYSSFRTPTYSYTSGVTETGAKDAYAATVAGTNCTPSTTSVSGTGAITIEVAANTSTTQTRTVSVSLTSGGTTISDSRTQSASVPTSQNVATFKPYIFPYNAGPYIKGKVYYQFLIESGSVTSSTITGLNFRYQVNGGTKQTVQIGSFLVEEHTDPTALEPQGITIPTFSSGTIKCWFEVTGSKGSFDVINADENTYYYETTL